MEMADGRWHGSRHDGDGPVCDYALRPSVTRQVRGARPFTIIMEAMSPLIWPTFQSPIQRYYTVRMSPKGLCTQYDLSMSFVVAIIHLITISISIPIPIPPSFITDNTITITITLPHRHRYPHHPHLNYLNTGHIYAHEHANG